jgi:hypothetical protein
VSIFKVGLSSNTQQAKIDREREIFQLSFSVLEELYGNFDIDNEQIDNPDAAIVLSDGSKRVGIEITSVDSQKVQAYFNDEKIARPIIQQQLESLEKGGSYTTQPLKKMSIPFIKEYIFKGVFKKESNYKRYMRNGNYHEMVIVAFSSYLQINSQHHFDDYHKQWTNYLLSKCSFPFNKVIFVCVKTRKATLVYDREKPLIHAPKEDRKKELGISNSQGSLVPFGVTFNYNDMFDKEEIIKPKNKSKKKNKTQRDARKINRRK